MKKPYKFQRPAGTRYIVNVNEWNKVFAKRGRWPFITCHVFVDHIEGKAKIHYYYTWGAKIVMGILFPVIVLVEGFGEATKIVKDCWFQKARGSFPSEGSFFGSGDWRKLMKLIRYENGR